MEKSPHTDISISNEKAVEILSFLNINQDTLLSVKEAAEILFPFKAEISEIWFGYVGSIERLLNTVLEHSDMDRIQKIFDRYLDQFFKAEVNGEYILSRRKIGQAHCRIHMPIEYFLSANQLLLQMMTSILMEELHHKPVRMMDAVLAVQKLAAFDQQFIAEVYMEETFKPFIFDISNLLSNTTQLDTMKNLINGMDKQIEETQNVTAATEEMSTSIHEVANHSIKVAEGTDEAVQSAEKSKKVVDEALNDINEVGHVYDIIVEKVSQLDQDIQHTQDVVMIIKEIAEQTNLLALNASIEAARAGEHGKGFSVVATEVRKLSEHTKEQIIQIAASMESLRGVSNQVTQQIKQTGKLVEHSVQGARFAGEALMNIVTTMKDINQSISQIAAMSEEQSSAVIDIADRNTIIYDQSIRSQEIAKQTAEMIQQLSKELEVYRNTFFTLNLHLEAKDIMKVAKTDHLLWKWKVYNMILGLEKIDPEQVTSHEVCRLGKWYYGDLPSHIKEKQAFIRIEDSHIKVHSCAKQAVEYFEKENLEGAQQAFESLEKASSTVIELLSQLENEMD